MQKTLFFRIKKRKNEKQQAEKQNKSNLYKIVYFDEESVK